MFVLEQYMILADPYYVIQRNNSSEPKKTEAVKAAENIGQILEQHDVHAYVASVGDGSRFAAVCLRNVENQDKLLDDLNSMGFMLKGPFTSYKHALTYYYTGKSPE
jgi:hypothetical protein